MIFRQVYKESAESEEEKSSLLEDAKIGNPLIEIPNDDPVNVSGLRELTNQQWPQRLGGHWPNET